MALTHEDFTEIKREFDERYVLQGECDNVQAKMNKKLANDDKRIDIIAHDFAVIKKLVWVVASASIGSLVTAIFELITG